MTKVRNFDESVLRNIIKKAIQEQKLFELIFTEKGKRLWASWSEEKVRQIVKEELKKRR